MVVVGVRGELDLAAAEAFEDAIASVRDASHVVVDLTDCTFLDSSGVRALSLSARDITSAARGSTSSPPTRRCYASSRSPASIRSHRCTSRATRSS